MTKCLRITKMIVLVALVIASLAGSAPISTGAEAGLTEAFVSETARSGAFPLVGDVATDIMTDTNDAAVVGIAAHLLAEDVERVTGCKPHVLANPGKGTKRLVVVKTH